MASVATRRREENLVPAKSKRIDLAPTGLVMEGATTSLLFVRLETGNERNDSITMSGFLNSYMNLILDIL